ncbi:MAG: transposase [Sulfurovum sp.]|nr:transposase [Sulfurovum sp.]
MTNHFHLLIETEMENLSSFMKHINGNYAIYANKKQKRSGHFWQGRYYSRYINSDEYFYTLIRYIEQNPVEAGAVEHVAQYPYTLGSVIANGVTPIPCTLHSKLLEELDYENIQEIIGVKLNDEELEILEKIKHQKIISKNRVNKIAYEKNLEEHFKVWQTKKERNDIMYKAVDDGYSQIAIADFLQISRSLVSKVLREEV